MYRIKQVCKGEQNSSSPEHTAGRSITQFHPLDSHGQGLSTWDFYILFPFRWSAVPDGSHGLRYTFEASTLLSQLDPAFCTMHIDLWQTTLGKSRPGQSPELKDGASKSTSPPRSPERWWLLCKRTGATLTNLFHSHTCVSMGTPHREGVSIWEKSICTVVERQLPEECFKSYRKWKDSPKGMAREGTAGIPYPSRDRFIRRAGVSPLLRLLLNLRGKLPPGIFSLQLGYARTRFHQGFLDCLAI